MSLYAVIREAGPAWVDGKGAFEQPGVDDHAAFMNTLADDPWAATERLVITSVEPRNLLVGAERLSRAQRPAGPSLERT
jgi:hypothetical protein